MRIYLSLFLAVLSSISSLLILNYTQIHLTNVGISSVLIGTSLSLSSILSIILSLLIAELSDKIGRRFVGIFSISLALPIILLIFNPNALISITFFTVSLILLQINSMNSFVLYVDLSPKEEKRKYLSYYGVTLGILSAAVLNFIKEITLVPLISLIFLTFSLVLYLIIKEEKRAAEKISGYLDSLKYIKSHLLIFFIFWISLSVTYSFESLLPTYFGKKGIEISEFSFYLSILALISVIPELLGGILPERKLLGYFYVLFPLFASILLIFFEKYRLFIILVAYAILRSLSTFGRPYIYGLFHKKIPNKMRYKVTTIQNILNKITISIFNPIAGLLLDFGPMYFVYSLVGSYFFCLFILIMLLESNRSFSS